MASHSSQSTFADWLRDKLEERGWGIRTLARKIASRNDIDSETARRALHRYLEGGKPSAFYRRAIALEFGVDVSELPRAGREIEDDMQQALRDSLKDTLERLGEGFTDLAVLVEGVAPKNARRAA